MCSASKGNGDTSPGVGVLDVNYTNGCVGPGMSVGWIV